jgi:3-oxoacyl-[acyl-carrier protein] reductase
MDLSGKVAIVTGSSRGIGKAIALKLADAGASVVVTGHIEDAEPVAKEIRAKGRQSLAVRASVTSAADIEKLVEATLSTFGRVDILVNNAGITRDQLVLKMSEDDWDAVLDTNLKSVFLCTRAVLRPMLKQRWGRIINISSVIGLIGNPGQANYAASKAGIIGFTRTIAKEVGSRGITANVIAPGFIETRMTQAMNEAQRQELIKRIPVGSLGTPEDVAEAAAFLASDGARYITGQVLGVDGGMGGA